MYLSRKIANLWADKKGEATYIYLCVLIMVFAILLSTLILYMAMISQIEIQKRDVQAKLDNYIASYAVEAYDAVKQGTQYNEVFDWADFEAGAVETLGFTSPGDMEYSYPNSEITMSRPATTVLNGNGFGITIQYTATFPIQWGGHTFADLDIPVTVTSYFKLK